MPQSVPQCTPPTLVFLFCAHTPHLLPERPLEGRRVIFVVALHRYVELLVSEQRDLHVFVCVCVCVCLCVGVHMHARIHTYTHTQRHMCGVHMHARIHTYAHTQRHTLHTHTHTYTHVCVYIFSFTGTHTLHMGDTFIYTIFHTHTHTHHPAQATRALVVLYTRASTHKPCRGCLSRSHWSHPSCPPSCHPSCH